MVHCVAVGCYNQSVKKLPGVTYHKFPKDVNKRQQWVLAVQRQNWSPTPSSRLCSVHFEEKYIDRTSLCCVRLRENAIPTIFHKLPVHLKRALNNKKILRKQPIVEPPSPEQFPSPSSPSSESPSPSLPSKSPSPSPPSSPSLFEKISELQNSVKEYKKKIRCLRRCKWKMKKKLVRLNCIIWGLKNKCNMRSRKSFPSSSHFRSFAISCLELNYEK